MPNSSERSLIDRLLVAVTLTSCRRPFWVLALACAVFAACSYYASGLRIVGSFSELLPDRDPTAQRYNSALSRMVGGGATLDVIVESPDSKKNRAFIDALEGKVAKLPRSLVTRVESGPKELRKFFEKWRWLFPEVTDLELVECELSAVREEHDPTFLHLGPDCAEIEKKRTTKTPAQTIKNQPLTGEKPASRVEEKNAFQKLKAELDARLAKHDRFPTGYFRNEEGTQYLLRITSPGAGMGEFTSDELLHAVKRLVDDTKPAPAHVGYAGSIPNAISERDALINDILSVSLTAVTLILLAIAFYFKTPVVLLHIGLCVGTGTAIAFAAAMAAYGSLNAATSFLVAIVVGNGINHGIVYLARYREKLRDSLEMEQALCAAALDVRKGTWLAALAASGAFACLLITSFRGFSEFGLIGGVGMLACWAATLCILPASVSAISRIRGRKPDSKGPDQTAPRLAGSGVLASLAARVASPTGRTPAFVLVAAAVLTLAAVAPLPAYLANPWEYDFWKLGSRRSQDEGAGRWSKAATRIVGVRGSPVLMLADRMDQVPQVARDVLAADQRLTGGRYVDRVETIYDALGGTPEVVAGKLEILGTIREHIDAALPRLKGEDREIAVEWRPPENLRPLKPADLPETLLQAFREKDGRIGTPAYAFLSSNVSQSSGRDLMTIARIFENVKLDGEVVPNASRAAIFASMIRSMERDAPRATLAALLLVVIATLAVARTARSIAAVLGSTVIGVVLTVGGAAWLDVRLNFLNFIAIPLTFGICVEYSINLHERMRVHGNDVARGLSSAGGAVFLCSLTTILGYGALLLADNRALVSFGAYAIAGEIACISTALLVMPAALRVFTKRDSA